MNLGSLKVMVRASNRNIELARPPAREHNRHRTVRSHRGALDYGFPVVLGEPRRHILLGFIPVDRLCASSVAAARNVSEWQGKRTRSGPQGHLGSPVMPGAIDISQPGFRPIPKIDTVGAGSGSSGESRIEMTARLARASARPNLWRQRDR